jgi:hypothetical protein
MQPPGELPQFLECLRELLPGRDEDLHRLVGLARQPRLGEAEGERERGEALLRAVVEVPLEAPSRGVRRRHDPAARRPYLRLLALAVGHVGPETRTRLSRIRDRRRGPRHRALAAVERQPA